MSLSRWTHAINRTGLWVAQCSLLMLLLIISYAVLARYVLQSPSVHAVEISSYLLVLMVWSAVGWTHIENLHVGLELFRKSKYRLVRTLTTVRALADRTVRIEGVDPIYLLLPPEEMMSRAFKHHEFDVTELSLSDYVVSRTRPNQPYVGIPVFLSRAFRHASIYIRNDRGMSSPEALKGRRLGIAEYESTANVWAGGLLEDDYGVLGSDIHWVRGILNSPGNPGELPFKLPPDTVVDLAPVHRCFNDLLSSGDIDGFIGPRPPACFENNHPNVTRLFPDSMKVASEYYQRTGIFPVMHILGVRKELATNHPWLPRALFKAFRSSRALAFEDLSDSSTAKVALPFVDEQLYAARRLMGDNFWSYGVSDNRDGLEKFLSYHHRQGMSDRKVSVNDLFHPTTFE